MYPPRPKFRIPPHQLAAYEKKGTFRVQLKQNGTHGVWHITPQGEVEAWRPGKVPHEAWSLSKGVAQEFLSLPGIERGQEYWLDGELLNNKTATPHYTNRIVLYDLLQAGKYLFGVTLEERLRRLAEICGNPTQLEPGRGIALQVSENVWMAETWDTDFVRHYEQFIDMPEIEGLVLKRKGSKLENFGNVEYEVPWLIRCRKEHKNYIF